MSNRRNLCVVACIAVGFCWLPQTSTAAQRNWQTGTVMDYEKQVVRKGAGSPPIQMVRLAIRTGKCATRRIPRLQSTMTRTLTRSTRSRPRRRPTSSAKSFGFRGRSQRPVVVGGEVKYAVDGNKMYLMGTDGKEHKGTIVKASVSTQ